jgi:hypothetical protein
MWKQRQDATAILSKGFGFSPRRGWDMYVNIASEKGNDAQ